MEDIIVIAIIVVIVAIGVCSAAKHFKGQGGCCGGSSYKPKKKRLKNVVCEKKFKVEGMHCDHCKNRVEEVVNDIEGVAARVNVKKGELTVLYAEDVGDELIIARIEKAGYKATQVEV